MKDHKKIEEIFMKGHDEHSDAIFRYCYFQTSNREVALDLAQDTFIKTWVYLKDGQKVDNLKAFLYKVAKNLIIDYRRKKKSYSLEAITDTGVDFASDTEVAEEIANDFDKQFVVAQIQRLDPDHREILTMRYIDEMSIKEIADMLEETPNNVSVKIHRAIEKMKVILKEFYES